MGLFDLLLALLYPRRCLSCGKFGEYICQSCSFKINLVDKNICPVCERPAVAGKTHPRCQTKYSLDGLTSIFFYQGVVREAIKKIKYKPFAFDISQNLASLALEKIAQDPLFSFFGQVLKKKPFLVPIPLHPSRERKRGFNQSEVFGKILGQDWDLPVIKDLLLRKRVTKPQVRLKGKARRENVKGAFKINSNYNLQIKSYKNILLFDDVWTTGATLRTASNVLKRGGVKFVWGLTLAKVK